MQTAAAGAGGPGEFFDRLRGAGVLVRERHSPTQPGQVTGYAVAWPGFRNRDGQPVWYGGGKLAADLSLPKLEAHWRCARTQPRGTPPYGEMSVRVRLRHEIERAAGQAAGPGGFLDELRQAGVLVKERYSHLDPNQLTGYAVALPHHLDPQGEPVWHAGGKLAADLSLPRLQARWAGGTPEAQKAGRTSRLVPEERHAVWDEARQAATEAAGDIRRLATTDPAGAADAARTAVDLLHVAARVAEPAGHGPLTQAAAAYDRASRDLYGRTPLPHRGAAADLRVAALALTLVRRAAPGEAQAVGALIVALASLADAVGELRAAQQRHAQATAAYAATTPLRVGAGAAAQPTHAPPSQTRTATVRPSPEPPTRGRRL